MWRPKSAKGAAHLGRAETPCQHLDPIAQHHRHSIPESVGKPRIIDIDRLQRVAPASGHRGHHRVGLAAQQAGAPGEEEQVAHCGTVSPVRPGTTIAILLLLALLLVAGVVFIVRLNAVT